MFKFNNSIVPNKVRIGWHFSSNKYVYRNTYLALKSRRFIDMLITFALHTFHNCKKKLLRQHILVHVERQS